MQNIIELFMKLGLSGLLIASIGGWVANIVKIFSMSFDPLTAIAVMRVVGIFVPPLGSVLGYL